jgi:hypothetical protein
MKLKKANEPQPRHMIALNLQNPDGKVTTEQYTRKEEGTPMRMAKQDGVLSFGIVSSEY